MSTKTIQIIVEVTDLEGTHDLSDEVFAELPDRLVSHVQDFMGEHDLDWMEFYLGAQRIK